MPAWMSDPALAAQAQAPGRRAPPRDGSSRRRRPSRPETDEEMARRLQAEWSAPAAPPTFPMEPVFARHPAQRQPSAARFRRKAYAHALALTAHVPAPAAPPPMLGAGPPPPGVSQPPPATSLAAPRRSPRCKRPRPSPPRAKARRRPRRLGGRASGASSSGFEHAGARRGQAPPRLLAKMESDLQIQDRHYQFCQG